MNTNFQLDHSLFTPPPLEIGNDNILHQDYISHTLILKKHRILMFGELSDTLHHTSNFADKKTEL